MQRLGGGFDEACIVGKIKRSFVEWASSFKRKEGNEFFSGLFVSNPICGTLFSGG